MLKAVSVEFSPMTMPLKVSLPLLLTFKRLRTAELGRDAAPPEEPLPERSNWERGIMMTAMLIYDLDSSNGNDGRIIRRIEHEDTGAHFPAEYVNEAPGVDRYWVVVLTVEPTQYAAAVRHAEDGESDILGVLRLRNGGLNFTARRNDEVIVKEDRVRF